MKLRLKSIILILMFGLATHTFFMWVWLNRYGQIQNNIAENVNAIRFHIRKAAGEFEVACWRDPR